MWCQHAIGWLESASSKDESSVGNVEMEGKVLRECRVEGSGIYGRSRPGRSYISVALKCSARVLDVFMKKTELPGEERWIMCIPSPASGIDHVK
jgi:hypothetical protein